MFRDKDTTVDDLRQLLGLQIRLDIARTLARTPGLEGDESRQAYHKLTADTVVERMIADVARDEVLSDIEAGRRPSAALLRLAGFPVNHSVAS